MLLCPLINKKYLPEQCAEKSGGDEYEIKKTSICGNGDFADVGI